MAPFAWLPLHHVLLAYVVAFGAAAVLCFAAIPRARLVDHDGTRRGLTWLLVLSGAWAAAHVGFLLAPTVELKLAAYYAGLTVGLAAVGPWLYFCSAYTGRTLHRSRIVRWVAVTGFLVVLAAKYTNPIHGYYFQATMVEAPFPHLAVVNGSGHWIAMGLAYTLSAIGYFMLLELFIRVGHDTRPLVALISVTSLPLVLDLVGAASPLLLDITYEPLGVAVMAVGLLFVYLEDFQTVRMAGEREGPIIVLDDDGFVRDYNANARTLFPALSVDEPIDTVVPEIAAHLDDPDTVVEVDRAGGTRYYQLSANPFSTASAGSGQQLTLTDITERQQYREQLERQNERLERFASVVSHDLRNPISVAQGRIDLALEELDGDGPATLGEDLAAASEALDRMEELVEDLLVLAREGQPIAETHPVALSTLVEDARSVVETDGASIVLEDDITFDADRDRVQQLLENLFRNAIEHGRPTESDADSTDVAGEGTTDDPVTITVGALPARDGFYVADDGPGIPPEHRADVFSFGFTTRESGTGFGLAIVKEVAEAHGWTIEVTDSDAGGARFEITGIDVRPDREGQDVAASSD